MSESVSYYAIIPAEIRYDSSLPPLAKLLFGEITALCSRYNECWATNEYFANLYNCSTRNISRLISLLSQHNYITVELVRKTKSAEIEKRVIRQNVTYGQNCREGIDNFDKNPNDKNGVENNTSNINNTSINIPPISPKPSTRKIVDNMWEIHFERFWELYPRKENKSVTKKWFQTHYLNEEQFETIISKLKTFIKTKAWKKNDGQFIPYPSTFLHQKRWEDEISDSDIEETKEDENERIRAEVEQELCH